MSGKDAEIERAFERAEKDAERHGIPGLMYPIRTFSERIPCPTCEESAGFKMKLGDRWYAVCVPCQCYWSLETDNERENG